MGNIEMPPFTGETPFGDIHIGGALGDISIGGAVGDSNSPGCFGTVETGP